MLSVLWGELPVWGQARPHMHTRTRMGTSQWDQCETFRDTDYGLTSGSGHQQEWLWNTGGYLRGREDRKAQGG